MTVVAYIGHAVGEKNVELFDLRRGDNIANSIEWVRFLRSTTQFAICYPSFVYLAAVDETAYQPRSFVDQLEILTRCDVYVPLGGILSPHMKAEWRHAESHKIPVLDLLYLGRVPPWYRKDAVSKEIINLADNLGLN